MNQKNWIAGLIILVVILVGTIIYFAVGKKLEPVMTNTPVNNQQTNLQVPSAPILIFTQGAKPFVQINFDYTIAKLFNIYRSTSATSSWQKIISNFPSNAHTAVDYDYPKSANTLYYRITSVDEQGKESAPSPATPVLITSNQDPTANWKTYSNIQIGFEAKHPQTWSVSVQNGIAIFKLPNDKNGTILIPVAVWVSREGIRKNTAA